MAEFITTVSREIEVGCDGPCGYSHHGHRMKVEVAVRGAYDPQKGTSLDSRNLEEQLAGTLEEVQGKPLDIIAPAQPTPEGLGLWTIERLRGAFPKIVEVTVWRDRQTRFSIRQEPR